MLNGRVKQMHLIDLRMWLAINQERQKQTKTKISCGQKRFQKCNENSCAQKAFLNVFFLSIVKNQ